MSNLQQLELQQDPASIMMLRSKSTGKVKYFVTKIRPTDVLFGRGSGPNDHVGNIRFRQYVAKRKEQYMSTNHRLTKTKIAREIVEDMIILQDRGRFLKKMEVSADLREFGLSENNGIDYYEVVDDDTIMEKAKQALRQTSTQPAAPASTVTSSSSHSNSSSTTTSCLSPTTTTTSNIVTAEHNNPDDANTYINLSPIPVSSSSSSGFHSSSAKTTRTNNVRSGGGGNKNFPDAIYDIEPLPLDPPISQQQQQQHHHHFHHHQQRAGPMHNNLSLVGSPLSATTDDWDMRVQYNSVNNNNNTLCMAGQQPEPQMDLRSMQEYAFTTRQQQIQLMQLRIQEQKIQQLQREILLEQEQAAFDAANSLYNSNHVEDVGSVDDVFVQQQKPMQMQQRPLMTHYPLSMSARKAQQSYQQQYQHQGSIQQLQEQYSNYNSSMAQLPHEDVTPFLNLRHSMTIRDLEKSRVVDKPFPTNVNISNNLSMSRQYIQNDRSGNTATGGRNDSLSTMDVLMDSFNQMKTPSMDVGIDDSINICNHHNGSTSSIITSPNHPQHMLSSHLNSRMMASIDTMGTIETVGSVNDMSLMMESSTFSLFREPSNSNNTTSLLSTGQKIDRSSNANDDGEPTLLPNEPKTILEAKNGGPASGMESQNSFLLSDANFTADLGQQSMNHDNSGYGSSQRINSKSSTNFSFTSKSITYLNNAVQQHQQLLTDEGGTVNELPRTIGVTLEQPMNNDSNDQSDSKDDDNDSFQTNL